VIDSYLDVGIPSGDVFRRELDSDEFARDMMDYLLVNLQSDDQERASQIPLLASRFVMKDGLLYYLSKAESTDSADLRLYIPESLRHSYMVAFHDSTGHLGVERMCRLLRARVYWPKLSQDTSHIHRAPSDAGRHAMAKTTVQAFRPQFLPPFFLLFFPAASESERRSQRLFLFLFLYTRSKTQ